MKIIYRIVNTENPHDDWLYQFVYKETYHWEWLQIVGNEDYPTVYLSPTATNSIDIKSLLPQLSLDEVGFEHH